MQSPNWQHVARTVLYSRYLDEREVNDLTPAGKIKYQFSAMGHELAQVLLAEALDHPHDAATVYYRSAFCARQRLDVKRSPGRWFRPYPQSL